MSILADRPHLKLPSLLLACGLAVTLALPLGAGEALAVTSAEKQAEADNISAAIDKLQTQLNEATATYEEAMDAYDAATQAADEAQARQEAAQERIAELQELLGHRAVNMYKGGSTNFLEVVLGSTTFEAFLTSWDALQMIADQDASMIEESRQQRAEAEAAEEEHRTQQAKAAEEMNTAKAAQDEIATTKASMEVELQKVTEEVAVLQAKEEEERIAAEEAQKRAQAAGAAIVPSGMSNGWVHPCPGYTRISTEFGYSAFHGTYHNGTDLAAPMGTPILACGAGTVSFVGWYGTGGNAVIISHGDGVRTIYMHMSKQAATVGQQVQPGTIIGYVGSTGNSTGPHLHFQVEVNRVPVNARNYINL